MKKILTVLTFLLISTLFFACSDSKDEPTPGKDATLEVTATLSLTATEKNPTRAVTLTDLTYVITNTATEKEVDKGAVPADGKLKVLTLEPGTYLVAITSSATGMPNPGFDTPIYGRTETVVLKAGDVKKLPVKSTQQNAGVTFTYADFAGAAVVAKIVHADGTLTYATNDDKKIGYFGPAAVEASFTVDGAPIKVNGKDKETLTLKAGELWKIKLSKTAASGAWVLSNKEPDPVTGELLEGAGLGSYFGSNEVFTEVLLDLYSADEKKNMYLYMLTTPTTFANVGLAVGEYTMASRSQSSHLPMTFLQGEVTDQGITPSSFFGYDAGKLVEYWVPSTSGKIVVSKVGTSYTIAVTLSGTYYNADGNKPFTDLTWTFKGDIKWTDKSGGTPGPIMDDIKAGAWSAAGVAAGAIKPAGPSPFAMTLTKKTDGIEFSGWAGKPNLPLRLYLNANELTTYPRDVSAQLIALGFTGLENKDVLFIPFGLFDGYIYLAKKTASQAVFDKTAQTLKLTGKLNIDDSPDPIDAYYGYAMYDKTTQIFAGNLEEGYKDLTITYEGTRATSMSYSDKISAEEINALISSGKYKVVNLPDDFKVSAPIMKRYISSYDDIFRK